MELNLFSPELIADPFPSYREMRQIGPVVRNELLGLWMITSHDSVSSILSDPGRFSSSAMGSALGQVGAVAAVATMGSADALEHTRLRGVAQRAFMPRVVAQLEQQARDTVNGVLDSLQPADVLDVVSDFSALLSTDIMAGLLGVSRADRESFRKWSDDLMAGASPGCDPEVLEAAEKGGQALVECFTELIAYRRQHPTERDLVSLLIEANQDSTITHDELVATCVLLIFAGHTTTTKLISNALLCLAQDTMQRSRLAQNPGLMGTAVEELVRFAGPIQAWPRLATEDAIVAGTEVKAGDYVMLMAACANRDPQQFAEPEKLDLGRTPNPHLGFSHGPHHCLGAALGRLETRVALSAFLQKAPDYELADPDKTLEWENSFFARGLTHLEIRL